MAIEGGVVHVQRVLDEVGGGQYFVEPGDFRVVLLHGYDLLDVRDVLRERFRFAQ